MTCGRRGRACKQRRFLPASEKRLRAWTSAAGPAAAARRGAVRHANALLFLLSLRLSTGCV